MDNTVMIRTLFDTSKETDFLIVDVIHRHQTGLFRKVKNYGAPEMTFKGEKKPRLCAHAVAITYAQVTTLWARTTT